MIIRQRDDYTRVSFGKLSEPGVVDKSPIYQDAGNINYYTTPNFQYIVDNIVDMYGYSQGTVSAAVSENDYELVDAPDGQSSAYLEFRFTMNAQINTYLRTSLYGKHFMYAAADALGYPVVFGIVAHEIGHLVAHNALEVMNTRIIQGRPALFVTRSINPYWDELCADYLAGITLSKAVPCISEEPLCTFLADTEGGMDHPHGHWRTIAVRMGYQWGKNNSPKLTDAVLSRTETQKELLLSFQDNYYKRVYRKTPFRNRYGKTVLSPALLENASIFLGFL